MTLAHCWFNVGSPSVTQIEQEYQQWAIVGCLPCWFPANTRHRHNVGPSSTTLAQHCINVSCLLGYVLDVTFVLASNVISTNIDGAWEQNKSTQHPCNVGPHIITIGSWHLVHWGGTGGCMCHYCGHVCCMLYVVHGLVWCSWNSSSRWNSIWRNKED